MNCAEVEPELVAYHFNALDDAARNGVEAHLVECAACVRELVRLKRAVETSEDAPPLSDGARLRLRRSVARELGIGTVKWSWWERPLALAVAASIVLVAGAATHALATFPGAPPHALASQTE
jgi:anti-sigma factor RsiW